MRRRGNCVDEATLNPYAAGPGSEFRFRFRFADEADDCIRAPGVKQSLAEAGCAQEAAGAGDQGEVLGDRGRDEEKKQPCRSIVIIAVRDAFVVAAENDNGTVHETDKRVAGMRKGDAVADVGGLELLAFLQGAEQSLPGLGLAGNVLDLIHELGKRFVGLASIQAQVDNIVRKNCAQSEVFRAGVFHKLCGVKVSARMVEVAKRKRAWVLAKPFSVLRECRLRQDVIGDAARGSGTGNFASRRGLHIANCIAGGEDLGRIQRAVRSRAAGATTEVGLDVSCPGRGRGGLFLFQGPFLLGTINLAQVVDAGVGLGRGTGMNEVGNRDGGQQTDDGHDDHDFDQGETRFASGGDFHTIAFFFLRAA